MRKILLCFLMLVMFTPALVCTCKHEAQAAAHGAGHHHDGGHPDKDKIQNCADSAPQIQTQVVSVQVPDLKKYFSLVWTDEKSLWSPVLAGDNTIRGPPPDWPEFSQTHPPILLTTQRFRV